MRSLRLKIALILIASIVAVVFVATAVTAVVLNSGEAGRMVGPMARHIAVAGEFFVAREQGKPPPREPPNQVVSTAPATGYRPEITVALAAALADLGVAGKVQVTQADTGHEPVAALQIGDGRWMLFPFPEPPGPPPQLLAALGAWLVLVVIGVVGVALVMAQRVTRPFAILERAIASVGPDGALPHMPEVGSGEARQTAASLNRLSDRVKAATESRMRLVAAAGHDLRTPMTRMRLRAEFLHEADRASWLGDIDELEAIADSAIHLVREEGAGEDRVEVALAGLVRECIDELRASGLPVVLVGADAATVAAGPLALKRALRNLLTNAATHGGGGRVRLSADADTATIIIDDDGPGIPDGMLAQVFEPFFRANPGRAQTVKGAGLGLAIAREIIERCGGSIAIRNRPSGGIEQVVTLRLAAR
ncbi:MAG: two-component sensor histidine kinase [Devosia nanyangense]|uniref:histidine kinase n=1 Tax=Devosia nanyangense TaxID=1228055 RepID=A0A933L2F7_9HYPH|nr:two-component sensor histidine kinase [Devosia nanyangense]